MAKWRVDIFRKRLLQLGTVTAPNAQEALTQAYNLFRIDPEARDRVTITKLKQIPVKVVHNLHAESTPHIGLLGGS